MKSFLRIILLFLMITTFSNCSSDKDVSTNETVFKAKINGELFVATKITQATLLHIPGHGQRFDITAENDKYKMNFAISVNQESDCMPTGVYANKNGREMLLFTYFSVAINNNNFLSVHFPVEDASGNTDEVATVTSCNGTKITGIFSGTYDFEKDPSSILDIPEDLVITEGVFQNIEFKVLN